MGTLEATKAGSQHDLADLPPCLQSSSSGLSVPGAVSEAGTQCSTRAAMEAMPTELMAEAEETARIRLPHRSEIALAA